MLALVEPQAGVQGSQYLLQIKTQTFNKQIWTKKNTFCRMLLIGTRPVNNFLLIGTVPDNNILQTGALITVFLHRLQSGEYPRDVF